MPSSGEGSLVYIWVTVQLGNPFSLGFPTGSVNLGLKAPLLVLGQGTGTERGHSILVGRLLTLLRGWHV